MAFNENPNPTISPYVLVTTKDDLALPSASSVDTAEKIKAMGNSLIDSAWRTIGAMESVKITGDKDKTQKTTTGQLLVLSEKLVIDSLDLNISEYSELRTSLNNKECKMILVDPDKLSSVPYAKKILLSVLPDISEDAKIKIGGESSNQSLDNVFSIVSLS